ncbi:MAG: hypothetical protein KC561_12500, partial [Myxococcales bacterium]|nr:hypothetical protein [Myxococcales bacterium]
GDLRVQTAAEDSPLEAGGSFTVDAAIAGESLVFVLDGEDDIVLMGFVDPRVEGVIDADSTAAALLYLALHLYAMPPDVRVELFEEVRAHTASAVLGDAVATALASDPKALMGSGTELLSAVEQAIASLMSASVVKSHVSDDGPIRPPTGNNGLVTMSPTSAQSGVEVGPTTDGRGLQVANRGRRAAWYYVYRTAVESSEGEVTDLDPPELIREGLLAPSDRSAASTSSLEQVLSGGVSYEASPLPDDIWVEVQEGQRRVMLEAVVAGAFLPGVSETPTWFDLGDSRHPQWQARAELMTRVSFLRDLLFPTLASFVFPTDRSFQGGDDVEALNALADMLIEEVPAVGTALEAGEWSDALRSSLDAMGRDLNFRSDIASDLFGEVAPGYVTTAIFALGRMQSSEFLITLHDIDSRAASIGVIFSDLETANALERWEGEALRASVILTARRPTLDPPHLGTDILATVPGADESERFCHHWTLQGPGEISALVPGPETGSANQVVSDEPTIDYDIASNELFDGPLGLISVATYTRPDGGCTFPLDESDLIGEAHVQIEGSEDEIIPCRGSFDCYAFQTYVGGIGLSLSGRAGGTASISFYVPEDTTEFEDGYRDVRVYFPRAVDGSRDAFQVSGDATILSSSIDEIIIPYLEDELGREILLAGGASISLRAKGSVRITSRTRGFAASCQSDDPSAPACCPYVTYIETWGDVWSGALGYAFVPSVGFSFVPLEIP